MYKARDTHDTEKIVAVKKVFSPMSVQSELLSVFVYKSYFIISCLTLQIKTGTRVDAADGINRTALREIKLLQELSHPNVIGVRIFVVTYYQQKYRCLIVYLLVIMFCCAQISLLKI